MKVAIVTCGINYLHREKFRSDLHVRFNTPIVLTVDQVMKAEETDANTSSPGVQVNYSLASRVTDQLKQRLEDVMLTAPDFQTLRLAKLACSLYAPLGTRLTLGQYVRLTQLFARDFSQGPGRYFQPRMLYRLY